MLDGIVGSEITREWDPGEEVAVSARHPVIGSWRVAVEVDAAPGPTNLATHSANGTVVAFLSPKPAVPGAGYRLDFWTPALGFWTADGDCGANMTFVAIGEGTMLSPESHAAQIGPDLLRFGSPLAGCPNCHAFDESYNYGLGVVLHGPWILQNPLISGYGAIAA